MTDWRLQPDVVPDSWPQAWETVPGPGAPGWCPPPVELAASAVAHSVARGAGLVDHIDARSITPRAFHKEYVETNRPVNVFTSTFLRAMLMSHVVLSFASADSPSRVKRCAPFVNSRLFLLFSFQALLHWSDGDTTGSAPRATWAAFEAWGRDQLVAAHGADLQVYTLTTIAVSTSLGL